MNIYLSLSLSRSLPPSLSIFPSLSPSPSALYLSFSIFISLHPFLSSLFIPFSLPPPSRCFSLFLIQLSFSQLSIFLSPLSLFLSPPLSHLLSYSPFPSLLLSLFLSLIQLSFPLPYSP